MRLSHVASLCFLSSDILASHCAFLQKRAASNTNSFISSCCWDGLVSSALHSPKEEGKGPCNVVPLKILQSKFVCVCVGGGGGGGGESTTKCFWTDTCLCVWGNNKLSPLHTKNNTVTIKQTAVLHNKKQSLNSKQHNKQQSCTTNNSHSKQHNKQQSCTTNNSPAQQTTVLNSKQHNKQQSCTTNNSHSKQHNKQQSCTTNNSHSKQHNKQQS